MLKLYDYYRSSAAFRVRIALNLKGLDYDIIPVHLLNNGGEQLTADYQKINPQQLVPSIKHDNHTLTQSLAIIEYINEIYPKPPLLPSNAYQKALVRAFALTIAADTHPLVNLRVTKYLTSECGVTEEQKTRWIKHWIETGLSALETLVKRSGFVDAFCFGEEPTLADICLAPQMFSARRFNCNLDKFPTLVQIDKNCQELEAVKLAWPKEPVT